MTQESEKGHRSWWWALPAAAGVALVMVSVMLWPSPSSNPGVPVVQAQVATDTPVPTNTPAPTNTTAPTATSTPNAGCIPTIRKSDDPTSVGEGGKITYTITIENEGTADCANVDVTDTIPDGTDCTSVSVTSAPSGVNIEVDEDDCDGSGVITWDMDTADELEADEKAVLQMVVELEDDVDAGDTITNEDACVTATGEANPAACDEETTRVVKAATATPTTAPTATTRPTVQPPVVPPPIAPPPVAPPPASLIAPMTGSGAEADGSGTAQTLALTLGLMGAGLLLVSGVAFAKRTH